LIGVVVYFYMQSSNGREQLNSGRTGTGMIYTSPGETYRIKELLFDKTTRRVKYLVVSLYGKPSHDVIISPGLAELNKRDKLVFFRDITVGHLALLPVYERGKITTETEWEIHSVLNLTDT
jgi:hypothetical protein